MTSIILVIAALTIPLVIGSVFVCVPKWWTKSVAPRLPDWITRDRLLSRAANDRWEMGAKILLCPLIFGLALAVWLIRGWFVIGLAVIEGACPYNGSFKWRKCLSDWFGAGKVPLFSLSPEDVLGVED
ncbi:hypothetical protein LCGC14_2423660 [marine sediment metagenome]|uniref:Uncharacterized protein n=1 Tax=marine sediment metagenome TaxID=412755 RepID=A0A0F9EI34_9ZZZZ